MWRTRLLRYAVVAAALTILQSAAPGAPLANCTHFGAGFPVFQCGFVGWFAPKPPAAGAVTPVWWQLHYGNRTVTNGFGGSAIEGTGMGPTLPTFSGNDSGFFNIVLTQASAVLPQYDPAIPPGALCSNFENSWSQPGVDGCADVPRTTADDDNMLNPYFKAAYGTAYCYGPAYDSYTLDRQVDYPMAILLTESTGYYFAFAAVASNVRGTARQQRCLDTADGYFNLGDVSDGDPNPALPGRNNIIPWQRIPKPGVRRIVDSDSADPFSDRIVSLDWSPGVRIVSDGSTRPSARALNNPGNGVGVLDQGPLARYDVESAELVWPGLPVDPNVLTWSVVLSTTDTKATVTVPPDSAIRLRTRLGVEPATSVPGLSACRAGLCGDVGFDMTGPFELIPGVLASEEAVDLAAGCARGRCTVTFRTTSELSVGAISLLAVGPRGERTLASIAPKEGTSGAGASYEIAIRMADLEGAKEIAVRLEGIGGGLISRSATVSIR